jgi:hypothetical protein
MRESFLCSILGSVLAIGVLGCGSGRTKSTASAPPPNTQHAGGQMCPMMQMAGANVVTSDTSDGVAVAFTTTGDVAELRAYVRRMAEMHNGMAGMHHGEEYAPRDGQRRHARRHDGDADGSFARIRGGHPRRRAPGADPDRSFTADNAARASTRARRDDGEGGVPDDGDAAAAAADRRARAASSDWHVTRLRASVTSVIVPRSNAAAPFTVSTRFGTRSARR